MAEGKSKSIPKFKSVAELVEFFETHDMGEYWDQMPEARFEMDLKKGVKAMAQETVTLSVTFEALANSVASLSLKDKLALWKLLDEQIAQAEEDEWGQDPIVQAEIREARAAYCAGDYVTIDEYHTQRREKV